MFLREYNGMEVPPGGSVINKPCTLYTVCTFRVFSTQQQYTGGTMEPDSKMLKNKEFYNVSHQSFKSFYKNPALLDITLVCNDNKLIRAHKLILASASPHMKDLITNSSLPGHVLNINVTSQNMEIILKYIYTGESEFQEKKLIYVKKKIRIS